MKARYLKRAVVGQLWDDIPNALSAYRSGDFSHLLADATTYFEGGFEVAGEELETLSVEENSLAETQSCKVLLAALPGLSPYEGRDERFWVYLTHTHLLNYTRDRWPIPDDDEKAVAVIKRHFFARGQRGFERDNAASRLWWMGHLCQRVQGVPFDEALKVFLFRSDVRANIIERPTVAQNTQIFSAIIKFLRASSINDEAIFHRDLFRPLMMRLNSVGGARLLDSMSEVQVSALLSELLQAQLAKANAAKGPGGTKHSSSAVSSKPAQPPTANKQNTSAVVSKQASKASSPPPKTASKAKPNSKVPARKKKR